MRAAHAAVTSSCSITENDLGQEECPREDLRDRLCARFENRHDQREPDREAEPRGPADDEVSKHEHSWHIPGNG